MAVSLLAQHQSNPSLGHMDAALHVIRYVAQTSNLGIYFSSCTRSTLESFLHFPLPPSKPLELSPFVSHSMSAFFIDLFGPLQHKVMHSSSFGKARQIVT